MVLFYFSALCVYLSEVDIRYIKLFSSHLRLLNGAGAAVSVLLATFIVSAFNEDKIEGQCLQGSCCVLPAEDKL